MNSQNEYPLLCPTFSSYTSDRLVEIATKVSDDYKNIIGEEENDDELFEFALSSQGSDSSIFPVFNRQNENSVVPLKTLFLQERENRISSTSSDESEPEEAPEANCMWRRKITGSSPSPSGCKKSKSTGSVLFKRFKICDFLRRSYSDGKESSYAFAAKIDKSSNKIDYRKPNSPAGKVKAAAAGSSAHEIFYVQNRSIKEGDKRKSYLPYRKDLIGFFSVLGRASRT